MGLFDHVTKTVCRVGCLRKMLLKIFKLLSDVSHMLH